MTIALLRKNGDLIWLDAVTQFSEKFSGTVSSHPLESGNVISDHTTINNRIFTLQGVVSDADFNLNRPDIPQGSGSSGELWKINNKQFINNTPVTSFVEINSGPVISKLIPESIAQIQKTTVPIVLFPTTEKIKVMLKIRDEFITAQQNAEEISVVEFRDDDIYRVVDQCIITSMDFSEQVDGGDALYVSLTLEQVRYATVKKTTIKKVANKGRKAAKAVTKTDTTTNDDAVKMKVSLKETMAAGVNRLLGVFK
jgi:hypothetical protein